MLVFRDELVGLLKGWEKQGHEQDRAFYLEAWNSHGSFPLDRIGRGHVICDNMCVSILGGTQHDKVRGYLYQAPQENDGLLQRFQLLVYPDPAPYAGMVDEYPDAAARDTAFAIFDALGRADFSLLAETDRQGKIPHLRFVDAAQKIFNTQYDDLHLNQIEAPADVPDGQETFAARDIYRKQWSLLDATEIVAEALNELTEAGWLLRDAQAADWQMRGHVRYRVNPKVRAT